MYSSLIFFIIKDPIPSSSLRIKNLIVFYVFYIVFGNKPFYDIEGVLWSDAVFLKICLNFAFFIIKIIPIISTFSITI